MLCDDVTMALQATTMLVNGAARTPEVQETGAVVAGGGGGGCDGKPQ